MGSTMLENDDILYSQAEQVASSKIVNIENEKESADDPMLKDEARGKDSKSSASYEPRSLDGSQVNVLPGQFLLRKYSHLQHQVFRSLS